METEMNSESSETELKRETMEMEMNTNTNTKISADDGKLNEIQVKKRRKGGIITMPFIIANESFEKVASYGLGPNMILYLMNEYHFGIVQGQNFLFFSGAAGGFMPLLGAFLADSYLGRFLTILFGSVFSFLGMLVLWLTAMISKVRPPTCDQLVEACKPVTSSQYFLLISAFALMAIGGGGVRPCSLAFGADQLDHTNKRVMESFFGWYYASASISVLIAVTGIVYVQDHYGWKIGFGIPVIIMFLSFLSFFLASPLYIMHKVTKSIFTSFAQVIVVAFKNRKLALPPHDSDGWYHHEGSVYIVPTNRLRFLNKACIIRDPEGVANNWSICTVEQVEELKALLRAIPIWSTGIMISINMTQSAFPIIQANSMDRHLASNFEIPAGSFSMFLIITICIWVFLYDRVMLPLAAKIRGKPVYLSSIQRMGMGLFVSILASIVSGIVEHVRKRKAIEEGFLDNPRGVLTMSAFWLIPQYVLHGLAEALNAISQTEFYYSEFPKSMSSIASSMFGLGMAVANLLASVVLSTVDNATKRNGKESWVSNNINKGHFEKYYWLLAIMSSVNLFYYIVCAWAYGPLVDPVSAKKDDKEEDVKEELSKV